MALKGDDPPVVVIGELELSHQTFALTSRTTPPPPLPLQGARYWRSTATLAIR